MNTHEYEKLSDELDTLENEYLATLKKVVIMKWKTEGQTSMGKLY